MQATQTQSTSIDKVKDRQNKYLTFAIGEEQYGLEILKVRGIENLVTITKVPKMPPYIKGVINLRGKVIPMIDLRLKFDMEEKEYNDRTCSIVVEINGKKGIIVMGIIVDQVLEVININSDEIDENVNFGTQIDTKYILGIAKAKDAIKIILDIDKVLTTEELSLIEKVGKSGKKE